MAKAKVHSKAAEKKKERIEMQKKSWCQDQICEWSKQARWSTLCIALIQGKKDKITIKNPLNKNEWKQPERYFDF